MVMSKDLEDLLTLVEGRAQLLRETADSAAAVRRFISAEISAHLANPDFSETLPAFFRSDSVSQQRLQSIRERLVRLSQL